VDDQEREEISGKGTKGFSGKKIFSKKIFRHDSRAPSTPWFKLKEPRGKLRGGQGKA